METHNLTQIRPYEKNAKKHPEKQIRQVAASIQEFGMNQPIVVDKDGVIIVGHGRFEACKSLGWSMEEILKHVKVVDLTEEQAKAYRLADNKLNESDWDMKLVIDELKELSLEQVDLTGFSRDLVLEDKGNEDAAPGAPETPRTAVGDLYELGGHRVLCGDSTSINDVLRLMDGKKADVVFTDPPYNVNYKGKGENTGEGILNDNMTDEAFELFLEDTFKATKEAIKISAGCYIFHSHKTASQFEKALKSNGFIIDTQLIWNKPSAGMGMNDYRTKHEPFFYCYLSEDKVFYGDRTGTTVWKIPEDPAKALNWFIKTQQNLEFGDASIWSMKRANVNEYVHPTQKPVELVETALIKSSKQQDIVLDQFLGSGTTLIAAEKAIRYCYGMELDPKFVDVIVQRWVNYTGITEVKKNGIPELWEVTDNKKPDFVL